MSDSFTPRFILNEEILHSRFQALKRALSRQDTIIRRLMESNLIESEYYRHLDGTFQRFREALGELEIESEPSIEAFGRIAFKQLKKDLDDAIYESFAKMSAHCNPLFQVHHRQHARACRGPATLMTKRLLVHPIKVTTAVLLLFDSEDIETAKTAIYCPRCTWRAYISQNWQGHTMLPKTRRARYCKQTFTFDDGTVTWCKPLKPDFIFPMEDTTIKEYTGLDSSVLADLARFRNEEPPVNKDEVSWSATTDTYLWTYWDDFC